MINIQQNECFAMKTHTKFITMINEHEYKCAKFNTYIYIYICFLFVYMLEIHKYVCFIIGNTWNHSHFE